jgi:Glycosyltransferases, probably involved in cell wall biogenesis
MAWNPTFPLLRLVQVTPTNQAIAVFPESDSIRFTAVPLWLERNTLLLATPLVQTDALKKELEVALRRPVRLFSCTWADYIHFQARCYNHAEVTPEALEDEFVAGLQSGLSGKVALSRQWLSDKPKKNDLLERRGLQTYLPHLNLGEVQSPKGLDLLLPEAFPRDHFVPVGWVDGTLFCLVDDPQWVTVFSQASEELHYPCQFVLADAEVVNRAYQRLVLRGPSKLTRSPQEVIDLLIENGRLKTEYAEAALALERQQTGAAQPALISSHAITADDWVSAYASLLGVVPLRHEDLPEDFDQLLGLVRNLIPGWLLHRFSMLPLVLENGTLLLGLSEIDMRVIDLAATLTHLKIEPRLMDAAEIAFWLRRTYPQSREPQAPVTIFFRRFLLELGYLSQLQSDEAGDWRASGWLDSLIEAGYLQEETLVEALSLFCGMPSLNLDHFAFNEELIRRFPAEQLTRNVLLPLFETENALWVAVANPFEIEGIRELAATSRKLIWPVLAPRSVLLQLLQRYHSPQVAAVQLPQVNQLLDGLVAGGLIKRREAFDISAEVVRQPRPLDQVILAETNLQPLELAQALSRQLKLPYEDLSLQEQTHPAINALGVSTLRTAVVDPVDERAAHLISLEAARQFDVLPIRFSGEGVVVAFADPLFETHRVGLELLLSKPVQPVLTTRQALEEAVSRTLERTNLGTTLLKAGMISRSQLNDALDYAHRANIRLGRALVLRHFITEEALYQFLAKQAALPFFDLSKALIDKEAAHLLDPHMERQYGLLPIAAARNKIILATADPNNEEGLRLAKEKLNRPVDLVLVTESDLENSLETLYRGDYVNESISALVERSPSDSATHVLERNQIVALIVMAALTVLWLVLDAPSYLIVLNGLITAFYLLFSIYKFRLIFKAISSNLEIPVSEEEVAALQDAELPYYTILVPVHREAEVLPDILKSLASIDYPAARLDILVLLEEDDLETIQKFDEINPPRFIQKIVVPNAQPKTKPKACNYGLIHARGEYVVIYDAEDLPDRDQLKRVYIAFSKTPANVACIQAKLNYYNSRQNILTQWFTVEYSMWFDLLLPGLDAEHAPIPLGGTSNHFKTYALVEAGAWDPYNVTEDADLGIRLFKRGYRTRIVDSTTYEEANSQYNNWIRQRSRWLKGYMQTWLVHMRHPIALIKEIGFRNFMSFQYIVGGTFFTALMNPFYWVMTLLWFVAQPAFIHVLFPGPIFLMGALCLYVGTFVFTYVNVAGAMRRGYYDMVRTAMLSPIYWAMSSIASWKGFVQLIFKPHFWEKTRHGLYQKPAETAEPSAEGSK